MRREVKWNRRESPPTKLREWAQHTPVNEVSQRVLVHCYCSINVCLTAQWKCPHANKQAWGWLPWMRKNVVVAETIICLQLFCTVKFARLCLREFDGYGRSGVFGGKCCTTSGSRHCAPMISTAESTCWTTPRLATVARNWALLSLAPETSCEDFPLWGESFLINSREATGEGLTFYIGVRVRYIHGIHWSQNGNLSNSSRKKR